MIRLHNGIIRVDAPCPANVLRLDLGAMPMVMEMNRHGILISPSRFAALDQDLARKEAQTLDDIERMVGWRCNPNAGDQVSRLLFQDLALESPLGPRMTAKRTRPACDDDILASLLSAHPVVLLIRAGRELTKLRGTYTRKLPLMAWADGRIRTTFRMNVARTGRMASEEPNCFDAHTEVLTPGGWTTFPNLVPGTPVAQWENGTISFVAPTSYTHSQRSTMRITSQHIDLCVTPDHRCLVKPRRSVGVKVVPASVYPPDHKQIGAGVFPGGKEQGVLSGLGADHIRLLIAVQADGSVTASSPGKGGGAIDFTLRKPRKVERLRGLLQRLGIPYSEHHSPSTSRRGLVRFYIPRHHVPQYITTLLGPHKTFGWWVLGLRRELIDVFVGEIFFWDGCWTRKSHYASRVKLNADVVQALCVLSGKRTNLRRYVSAGGSVSWQIDITHHDYTMTTNVQIERDRPVEDVYCVAVPSSYLLVRRSGKVMVTGNCQNIPAGTEDGRRIRSCFIARPGCVLGAIDLSQIEMVWAAELSGDPVMGEVYSLGQDLHVRTACALFQLDYQTISAQWKQYKKGELVGAALEYIRDFELNKRLPAKCFHPDTEVLTKAGWKRIMSLAAGEEVVQAIPLDGGDVRLEWAKPTEVYSTRHPSGKLVHLHNQGMDLRVTPDHRMLGLTGCGKHKVVPAAEFAGRGDLEYWHNSGVLETSCSSVVDDRLLRLAVALQADGFITPHRSIRFGFSRARKADRLRHLLQDAGVPYREGLHHNGNNGHVLAFSIHKADACPILALLDPDKTMPWWWLHLSRELRSVVLDEVGNWDSCHIDRRYMYSSRKKKNIDVLQALAAITNRKARAGNLSGPDYTLSTPDREHGRSRTGNLHSTEMDYTGDVACLSVPSTYVLVRDRGVTVICGQTLGFAVLYGVTPGGLQAQILAAGGPLLTIEECEAYIHAWYAAFPGVRLWMATQHSRAQRYGMVWTAFGRHRLVSEAMSAVPRVRSGGLRQSGNHPIQGSAGDQLKLGMAAILPLIDYYRSFGPSVVCNPLLQVHDELIFELTPDIATDFLADCNHTLTTCVRPMSVPVRASTAQAQDWGGLK